MARKLTIRRFVEIVVLALFVLGLAAGVVVPMEAVPRPIADATAVRQAAIVGGMFVALVVVLSAFYRLLPESRV